MMRPIDFASISHNFVKQEHGNKSFACLLTMICVNNFSIALQYNYMSLVVKKD